MNKKQPKYTIKQFNKDFPDDDACLNFIFAKRYNHLKDFKKYYRVKGRKCFAHSETGKQIHPVANTIFHKSSTKLTNWFMAIFLFSQSRNGVSAKELERVLGVTYKCAWRMAKQIRLLMEQGDEVFNGTVEADETYYGGRKRRRKSEMHKSVFEQKTPIVGVVKRQGGAAVKAVDELSRYNIMNYLKQHVRRGSNLMTDESRAYQYAKDQYNHNTVQHGKHEYVRGGVHTNSVEGFWSQLKRSIDGTYHCVSVQHLQKYLDEFVFRYNARHSSFHVFELLLARV